MQVFTQPGVGDQPPVFNQLESSESKNSPQREHLLRETEHLLPVSSTDTAKSHLPEMMLVSAKAAVDAPVEAPRPAAAPPPPFEQTPSRVNDALVGLFHIEHNNLNGSMTNAEINRLMQRTNLTDDQAIMLAAMRSNFDAIRALDPGQAGITNTAIRRLSELWQRRVTGEGAPLTEQQTTLINTLQSSAGMHRGWLEGSNRSLYATPNARDSVVPSACSQGNDVGNCHFVSAMTSLAQTDPAAIVRMIRDNHNGTYTVTFPGQEPIRVNAPTNAELAFFGTGDSHGLWSTVLQQAYGRLWTPGTANPAIEGAGGSMRSDGLRTLTGQGMTTTHTGRLTFWSTLNDSLQLSNQWPTTATVFAEAGEALFGNAPSTGFTGQHEYAVLGFVPNPQNLQAGRVTIQNPHRTMHWPNNRVPAGMIDHGDGRVEMSLQQFNDIFFNVSSAVRPRPREIPRLGN